jgi:glucose/arabinose dehydrogenase
VAFAVLDPGGSDVPAYDTCTADEVDGYEPPVTITNPAPAGDSGVVFQGILEVESPTGVAFAPDDGRMYVSTLDGRVLAVNAEGAEREESTIIDISDEVNPTEQEQGLFDVELSPDGTHLYLSYAMWPELTTKVDEWTTTPDGVDPASRRTILAIPKEDNHHNGGDLWVDPEGLLYVSTGDDYQEKVPDGGPAQQLDNLHGKILRIDPTPSGDQPYAIPPDNPFVDQEGARPEIWSYGLRNPWRFTVDEPTGDLWIADVGHNCFEEIDHVVAAEGAGAGANFGWNWLEGVHEFLGDWDEVDQGVLPAFELSPSADCGVIGGVVVHDPDLPDLEGAYLFTDLCNPRLRGLRPTADGYEVLDLGIDAAGVIGFGQGPDGQVYALSTTEGVERVVAPPR